MNYVVVIVLLCKSHAVVLLVYLLIYSCLIPVVRTVSSSAAGFKERGSRLYLWMGSVPVSVSLCFKATTSLGVTSVWMCSEWKPS